ncbi:replication initiator [Nonomuraea sp. NPDC050556]|uniref:replication initiator n=1 Tax=Nonomuraea sp. NPDC050556 TaxID=3364369 RepID=UPI0037BBC924
MPANPINAHAIQEAITRLNTPDYDRWATQIRHTNACRNPIHLRGHLTHHDTTTGAILSRYTTRTEPNGILRIPCKTRRASRCPSCAETYRTDTFHLIRAGLIGGKGVPTSVSTHPCLFVTLTAPSFGLVHTRREPHRCHPRRNPTVCTHGSTMACTARHQRDDTRLGEPLCPGCYDFAGTVLFNAVCPLLWKRLTDATRRQLAKCGGLTLTELRHHATLSFAKVAEYQKRGVVHFHAVTRLDGPDGPSTSPPPWATAEALAHAVRHAAKVVSATIPGYEEQPARTLRWGTQLDIRPITLHGDLTEQAVAAYVAKYATKATECVGILDQRLSPLTDLTTLPIHDHARRLIAACFSLGALDDLAHLNLIHWAHMLGFGGHFSTRSRHFSTDLGTLRRERQDHVSNAPEGSYATGHWHYVGQGLTAGEKLLAASVGAR